MGGWQQGHDVRADTVFPQYLMNQGHFLTVRTVGILTAFEYTGITALEAEREDVEGHVGSGLVDHADDTERHTDATEAQAVRQCLLFGDMPEGRRQGGHTTHIGGDSLQTAICQLQTVVEGIRLLHLGEVLSIGCEDSLLIVDDGIGYGIQYLVPLFVA